MKPQSDDDLKRAFLNCLNKLAWSQGRTNPEHRILDVYERCLGRSAAEEKQERLQEIEAELEQNRRENQKLTAVIMRERFLPKHREKKTFLDRQSRELMDEKNRLMVTEETGTVQDLKEFINRWQLTDDVAAFPDKAFTEFIESCTVNTQKMVTFRFRCGLKLTESLFRTTEVELSE